MAPYRANSMEVIHCLTHTFLGGWGYPSFPNPCCLLPSAFSRPHPSIWLGANHRHTRKAVALDPLSRSTPNFTTAVWISLTMVCVCVCVYRWPPARGEFNLHHLWPSGLVCLQWRWGLPLGQCPVCWTILATGNVFRRSCTDYTRRKADIEDGTQDNLAESTGTEFWIEEQFPNSVEWEGINASKVPSQIFIGFLLASTEVRSDNLPNQITGGLCLKGKIARSACRILCQWIPSCCYE